MKKALMGMVVLLAGACSLGAQGWSVSGSGNSAESNLAVPFANSSDANVNLGNAAGDASASAGGAPAASADPAPAAAIPAAPAAKPRFVFGDRDDYRWQLGVGGEFFRFRSSLIQASMGGLNTNLTYFTNDWFGFEGNIATGFAPTIYKNDHVKYFGTAGGVHVGSRRARWEPWGHALFGFGHLQPQTAGNSRDSLAITAGGGVDYRVYSRLSLRAEADYVYTRFFKQTQNDFQAFAGAVVHF